MSFLFSLLFCLICSQQQINAYSIASKRSYLKMDVGEDFPRLTTIQHSLGSSPPVLKQKTLPIPTNSPDTTSQSQLLFAPFWDHQLKVMNSRLANLQQVPAATRTVDCSIQYGKGGCCIVNACFESDEFRKIRMTYYDDGRQAQVFNSLWYPRGDAPLLGIDLLQFGTKHLVGMDFQPLIWDHHAHARKALKPIRLQYPSLQQQMSNRFYDETQFFSPHILFGRFQDSSIISRDVWPAYTQALDAYVELLSSITQSVRTTATESVLERHAAYDKYSAERDPALALFRAKFGPEWADEYVHEFLFDQCRQ
jgi:15,16-dihydrobiliverdin:ferredoxin oxidoreductase